MGPYNMWYGLENVYVVLQKKLLTKKIMYDDRFPLGKCTTSAHRTYDIKERIYQESKCLFIKRKEKKREKICTVQWFHSHV